MLWRRAYETEIRRGYLAAEGAEIVIGVPTWDGLTQAELWLRLCDRDLPDVRICVRLFIDRDEATLEAAVPPSRVRLFEWAAPWPLEKIAVFASVPAGGFTVIGPPTEEAWDQVVGAVRQAD